ncbi:MAG: GlcNAc-PI de-N-acetylase [Chloroflexi bacterium GWB2_49_20]|nr:MAG: GlcNAc-PI de-N-acetylase [Chloroflexi bacterium GWB2_49_20]OGN78870.1 MAG: GlcNAc-PI de-N-acetylase [Chloroflexi bacterium GWC2_49_37]OGN86370.1 MAG: GlcNAc-PI de-N-acetylase [Chloroflexi bacterium GWD2_49_16]HBG74605.1 GlcNAc-PI de-N-acetylase [Anaerolineae bacterium]
MNKKNVLLIVLAHPDDESFGMGGTLAYYAAQDVDVHLICATKGEAGDVSPDKLIGYDSIASLREAELRCAAGILGLTGVHFLGFRDSGMPGSLDNKHPKALVSQPIDIVSEAIVRYIRELQPQVVVTFDPIGGYRHPDHIAIHNATVRAFDQAGDSHYKVNGYKPFQPERLYFHTFSRGFLRTAVKILKILGRNPKRFGRNRDIDLESFANENFPIHAVIDIRKFRQQKEKAGSCHASQGGGRMGGRLLSILLRIFGNNESFMQAYPPISSKGNLSHDLFCKHG